MRAHSPMYSRTSATDKYRCCIFPCPFKQVIPYAHKDSQIPTRPSWIYEEGSCQLHPDHTLREHYLSIPSLLTLVPLAVCASFVAFKLEKGLDGLLILSSSLRGRIWWRSSRHVCSILIEKDISKMEETRLP